MHRNSPRTGIQLGLSGIVAGAMMLAFAAVGGMGAGLAHGQTSVTVTTHTARSNHGSVVSQVAKSTCTATVSANPSVSNHGQCVRAVARSQHGTETATETETADRSMLGVHGKAGAHHGKHLAKGHAKHGAKSNHGKHGGNGHH